MGCASHRSHRSHRSLVVVIGILAVVTLPPFFAGCVRPTNGYDPEAPDDVRVKGTLRGVVRVLLDDDDDPVAPDARVDLIVDDGTVATTQPDGSYSIEVKDGVRTLVAHLDGTRDAAAAPVAVLPGVDVTLPPIVLVDATAPSPVLLDAPPPAFTNAATLALALRGTPVDAADNFALISTEIDGAAAESALEASTGTLSITLKDNTTQLVVLRALDEVGNESDPTSFLVTHDTAAPADPAPTALAGNARIDLAWTSEPGAASFVEYGDAIDVFNGTAANEGASPIAAFGEAALRLSGLVNGHTLFVRVRVRDAAGNETVSAPVAVTPALVTPTVTNGGGVPLSSPAIASAIDGRFVFVVEENGTIAVADGALGTTAPAIEHTAASLGLSDLPRDIHMYGRYAIVTGDDGIHAIDMLRPDAPTLAGSALVEDEWGACAGGVCTVVGFDVVDGVATVAARGAGVWWVDLDKLVAGVSPVGVQSSGIGAPYDTRLVGPVKVFGRFAAIGEQVDVNGELANTAVLVVQNAFGQAASACQEYVPTFDSEFVEVFVGEGITNPEPPGNGLDRVAFDISGDTLFAAFDGSMVAMEMRGAFGVDQDCDDAFGSAFQYDTADRAIGVARLGTLSARSVTAAGAYAYIVSRQRSTALAPEERIDVVTLANRQDAPGAVSGSVNELAVVGRINVSAAGAPIVRGASITVADDAVRHVQVFDVNAPVFVKAVGENPTGSVTGMGHYAIHQRTDRGVGIWDIARPDAPAILNGNTCIPGCFTDQTLAGDIFLEGGRLHGATSNANGAQSLFVTDVASDVRFPFTIVHYDNLCSSGDTLGFARDGDRAFLGCKDVAEIHVMRFFNPEDGALVGEDAGLNAAALDDPIRALAVARTGDGADATLALFVLDAAGALTAFDLALYDGTASPVPLAVQPASLGWATGRRIAVDGDRLYALGATAATDCDANAATPDAPDTELAVIDLLTLEVVEQTVLSTCAAEPTQTVTAYPDVVVVGRGTSDARYDVRERDGSLRAVAAPNAFTLDAAILGGHLVSAAMSVFAVE